MQRRDRKGKKDLPRVAVGEAEIFERLHRRDEQSLTLSVLHEQGIRNFEDRARRVIAHDVRAQRKESVVQVSGDNRIPAPLLREHILCETEGLRREREFRLRLSDAADSRRQLPAGRGEQSEKLVILFIIRRT